MSVYVIASLTIKDAVRFEDYKRTVLPSMEKYGGRFVARGGPIHVLEGSWPRERLIIAEFPSMERAQQWWVSPEYAEPKALRQATADSELSDCPGRVVEGQKQKKSDRANQRLGHHVNGGNHDGIRCPTRSVHNKDGSRRGTHLCVPGIGHCASTGIDCS